MEPDPVPPELQDSFLERSHRTLARKGQILIAAGVESDDVFYIVSGTVQILLHSAHGKDVIVRELGEGSLVGEYAAIDGLPRSADVVALTDLELARLSSAQFRQCLAEVPEAGLWIAGRLVGEVRRLTDRLVEQATFSVSMRLHCELLRLCSSTPATSDRVVLENAPTHSELAARIGTHREMVTRGLRDLNERGLVRMTRRHMEVPSLKALVTLVAAETGGIPVSGAGVLADTRRRLSI